MAIRIWATGAALAALLAGPLWAEDIALVIGNRDYRDMKRVTGAERVVPAAGSLRDQGIAVVSGQDVPLDEMHRLMGQFEQMAPSADALLVILAGRFVQGGNDTFFLPVDSDLPGLTGLPGQSLPLSSVLQILSLAPGDAFLVLAEDGTTGDLGPLLRQGIGDLNIPQGVTVVRGAPLPVAELVRDVLSVVDQPLNEQSDLALSGYLPAGHGFLSSEAGGGNAALTAAQADAARERTRADGADRRARQAEQEARSAQQAASLAQDQLSRAEAALWAMAQEIDAVSGYSRYVQAFPDGPNAAEAGRLIGEIRDDPFRLARLAEDGLALSRDQRRAIQRNLTALGFNTRGVDGIFGNGTRTAIRNWQAQGAREVSGFLDRAQIRALEQQIADVEANRRAEEEARAAEALRADNEYWRRLGGGQSEDALRTYLDRFPRGQFSKVARERLTRIDEARRTEDETRRNEELRRADDAYWSQTGAGSTERGLRAYLDRYPNGRWADTARTLLASIASPPDKSEELAWQLALGANSVEALENYLATYPRGVHADDARSLINALEGGQAGGGSDRAAARAAEDALGLNGSLRKAVEERLAGLGFDPGQVDGEFDRATRRALRDYQKSTGLPTTGYVSQQLVVQLLTDSVLNLLGR